MLHVNMWFSTGRCYCISFREMKSPPSEIFGKVTTLSHIRACVCACTSPIQISLETVDRHFKTHSPRALHYLIWRARTGAEIILFKKKKSKSNERENQQCHCSVTWVSLFLSSPHPSLFSVFSAALQMWWRDSTSKNNAHTRTHMQEKKC